MRKVNKTNKQKSTPLHLAAFNGHVAVARLLLKSRTDATFENQWGPPLAFALDKGHEEVAMLLDPSDN